VSRPRTVRFRLYVADQTPNSAQALANLTAICEEHLTGRYAIEVVDVFHEPARALKDGILMTPTLLTRPPLPDRKIVGTLSETKFVVQTLGLEASAA